MKGSNSFEHEKFQKLWSEISWKINLLEILVGLGMTGIVLFFKFNDFWGMIVFLVAAILVPVCELMKYSIKNKIYDALRESNYDERML